MAADRQETERRLAAERDRLRSLRDGLREGLSGETESESLEELSGYDQHPADTGTETFNRERDQGTLETVESELDDVERALQRLEEGTYGVCTACGRPISAERLEALPATPYCIDDAELAAVQVAPGAATVAAGDHRRGDDGLEEPTRPI